MKPKKVYQAKIKATGSVVQFEASSAAAAMLIARRLGSTLTVIV